MPLAYELMYICTFVDRSHPKPLISNFGFYILNRYVIECMLQLASWETTNSAATSESSYGFTYSAEKLRRYNSAPPPRASWNPDEVIANHLCFRGGVVDRSLLICRRAKVLDTAGEYKHARTLPEEL
jgi:hypothetical protein